MSKALRNSPTQNRPTVSPAVLQVMNKINKTYGEGTVVLGNEAKHMKVRRIKSGIFDLDYEIGGGFPLGRVVQIHGPFSSGKTTIAMLLAAQIQKKKSKNLVAYLDVEGTFDIDWAKTLGVQPDKLLLPPNVMSGQAALNIAEELVQTGDLGLVVIDSLAAVTPNEEVDAPIDNWTMGLQARLINKFIRKIVVANSKKSEDGTDNECIVLMLNQERDSMDKYKPIQTPGGRGKDFASSLTIQIRKGEWIEDGKGSKKKVVGHVINFKVLKNKTFPRAREGQFDFYFDKASWGMKKGQVDNTKSIVLKAIELGLIKQGGAWFSYNGKQYQGQDKLVEALTKKEDLLKKLRVQVLATLREEKDK
jgi:recombination protein RecA